MLFATLRMPPGASLSDVLFFNIFQIGEMTKKGANNISKP